MLSPRNDLLLLMNSEHIFHRYLLLCEVISSQARWTHKSTVRHTFIIIIIIIMRWGREKKLFQLWILVNVEFIVELSACWQIISNGNINKFSNKINEYFHTFQPDKKKVFQRDSKTFLFHHRHEKCCCVCMKKFFFLLSFLDFRTQHWLLTCIIIMALENHRQAWHGE
jgi:hypothetical protein